MLSYFIQHNIQLTTQHIEPFLHIRVRMSCNHFACFKIGDCNLRDCAATFFS